MENEYIVVLVTAASKEQAQTIAIRLIEEKLAACVSIVDGVTSVFRWEGTVEQAAEVQLVIKTRRVLFNSLVSEVKRLHSYKNPEIIALPIVGGTSEYISWIDTETQI